MSTAMTKIFTFGSCVSRDIFNHTPEDAFEVTLNIQRMSYALLPLKGYPIAYEEVDIDYLEDFPWEVKMMITEVSKTGLAMAEQADAGYVVMDLIEERFDFAEFMVGTEIYRCVKTGHFDNFYDKYLKEKARNYRELSIDDYTDEEAKSLFCQSVKVLLKKFWISDIILLETYYAYEMIDDAGAVTAYEDREEIQRMNRRLQRVYRLMKEVLEEFCDGQKKYHHITAPANTYGYANHKWGPFPVHYTDDFYEYMGQKIQAITENNGEKGQEM